MSPAVAVVKTIYLQTSPYFSELEKGESGLEKSPVNVLSAMRKTVNVTS